MARNNRVYKSKYSRFTLSIDHNFVDHLLACSDYQCTIFLWRIRTVKHYPIHLLGPVRIREQLRSKLLGNESDYVKYTSHTTFEESQDYRFSKACPVWVFMLSDFSYNLRFNYRTHILAYSGFMNRVSAFVLQVPDYDGKIYSKVVLQSRNRYKSTLCIERSTDGRPLRQCFKLINQLRRLHKCF
jgi:hypothetical protein